MSPFARDALLTAVVAVMAEAEVLAGSVPGSRAAEVALAIPLTLPLLVRRSYPLTSLAVVCGSMVVQWASGIDLFNYLATVVAGLVVIYTAAAHLPPRRSVPGLAYAYGCVAVSALRGPAGLAWGLILVGGAWLAGYAIRDRRLHAAKLEELTRALAEARDEHTQTVLVAERTRIARELHDIVAHAVSVMVVQAGAAEQILPAELSAPREAMLAVQQTGRQALVELRRLLGVLRADEARATRDPQPGLDRLDALAQQVREAGVEVACRFEAPAAPVPRGLDLAAYRIVQEALTNTLKHARATRADVTVRVREQRLELEVVDDGEGGGANGSGQGHGLVGMRERAHLYGGELEAHPLDGRGFAVRAWLPLRADT
jgi:signal transduction histidine kinase